MAGKGDRGNSCCCRVIIPRETLATHVIATNNTTVLTMSRYIIIAFWVQIGSYFWRKCRDNNSNTHNLLVDFPVSSRVTVYLKIVIESTYSMFQGYYLRRAYENPYINNGYTRTGAVIVVGVTLIAPLATTSVLGVAGFSSSGIFPCAFL